MGSDTERQKIKAWKGKDFSSKWGIVSICSKNLRYNLINYTAITHRLPVHSAHTGEKSTKNFLKIGPFLDVGTGKKEGPMTAHPKGTRSIVENSKTIIISFGAQVLQTRLRCPRNDRGHTRHARWGGSSSQVDMVSEKAKERITVALIELQSVAQEMLDAIRGESQWMLCAPVFKSTHFYAESGQAF